MNNCFKIRNTISVMVLLSMVIILTVVLPLIRWIDRNGYDMKMITALVIPFFYFILPFHLPFYNTNLDYLSSVFPREDPSKTNYIAIILSSYSIFFLYAIITYGVLWIGNYGYWFWFKGEPYSTIVKQQEKRRRRANSRKNRGKNKSRRRNR